MSLEVTAFDGSIEIVKSLALNIAAVNDAPVIGDLTPLAGVEDQAFSAQLDAAAFTDVDGNSLSISLRGAGDTPLPTWLSFDTTSLTISGTRSRKF